MKLDVILLRIFVVLLSLFSSGCTFGPKLLENGYLSYNDRVRATTDEELLLNIVRLRYLDTIEFLSINSISAQASFNVSLGAEVSTNDSGASLVLPELSYSDRPTFSFTPQRGTDFAKRLVEPIKVNTLAYLAASDWPIKILMQLLVKEVNGIINESYGHIASFNKIAQDLGRMQDANELLIAFAKHEKAISEPIERTLIQPADLISAAKAGYSFTPDKDRRYMRLSEPVPQPIVWLRTAPADIQQVRQMLQLGNDNEGPIELHAGTKGSIDASAYTHIHMRTRSVLGAIVYLAQGVIPPSSHLEKKITIKTWPFPGLQNNEMDQIFKVQTATSRPQASLAVQYRGHWFYIDETDLTSKATFLVLSEIYRLALISSEQNQAPLLTLPLGGS